MIYKPEFYNNMVLLITPTKAQKKLAEHARTQRLQMELTQEGLAKCTITNAS